jgi:alkanesulfonate monooxygenase SsuD/methylene tetrahydromethanopterin reductase-like flavin-dependent oxidoreductase (luciferase family)
VNTLHLAVALDGAGWHPSAWRTPEARPKELFTAGYWTDLVAEAERGLLDFVTIEDSLTVQSAHPLTPDERTDQVRGRLDAVLVAARVAPVSRSIGLVPVVSTTHTEPFHVSKAIATLDYASTGRAGWQVRAGAKPSEATLFGRRELPSLSPADLERPDAAARIQELVGELFDEAADHVEVVRRLWDSWQDDAEIRDAATGRFVDRDRLHYIDFVGRWFSVRGPSITPRPPQGQPIVAALAHGPVPYRLAARQADLVFVTPHDAVHTASVLAEVGAETAAVDRADPLLTFADLVVFIDEQPGAAAASKSALDGLAGEPLTSDARVVTGTPTAVADEIEELGRQGFDGVRLRPGRLPYDLTVITDALVPELQRRGLFRRSYDATTLRGHLGLSRPANRYELAVGRSA